MRSLHGDYNSLGFIEAVHQCTWTNATPSMPPRTQTKETLTRVMYQLFGKLVTFSFVNFLQVVDITLNGSKWDWQNSFTWFQRHLCGPFFILSGISRLGGYRVCRHPNLFQWPRLLCKITSFIRSKGEPYFEIWFYELHLTSCWNIFPHWNFNRLRQITCCYRHVMIMSRNSCRVVHLCLLYCDGSPTLYKWAQTFNT